MLKSFSSFHPVVLLVYYVAVIAITITTMHPIVLGSSIVGSLIFFAVLNPFRLFVKEIVFYFLVFLLIVFTNLLFVHNGESILFFMNDRPITVEAGIYGIALALMLVSIAFWNKSFSELVSTDKLLYLFAKVIPSLAIWLSMFFRFVPLFKKRLLKVHQAQKALGYYTSDSITDRLIGAVRIVKSTLIWTLEDAFSMTDSMKARGYGLKGRTNFSIFTWQRRDYILLSVMGMLCLAFVGAVQSFYFYYFPVIAELEIYNILFFQYITVFLLMIIPSIIEVKENVQWKFLRSRM